MTRTETMSPVAASLVIAILLPTVASGAQHCVNPGGTSGCFASIQAAVDAAADRDEIVIAAGTYIESFDVVDKNLTISGAGADTTIVEGAINVEGGRRTPGTTLRDLRVQNASDYGITSQQEGNVLVERCKVIGNEGGVLVRRFANQKKTSITVVDSTIGDNVGQGVTADASEATVRRSTISGNGDGGVMVRLKGGRVVIEDSTVSGNMAADGAGIAVHPRSFLSVTRSTIANNSASASGGGIAVFPSTSRPARVRLQSSILADNTAPIGPDCASERRVGSRGFNLIESLDACPLSPRGTDVTGQDPLLGPLQDNGGPTETQDLLAGSPAIGVVVSMKLCSVPDQRGVPRALPCDIGAFEAP
jgi:hypothetical protein